MSWGTCYSASNNIHFDFPPLMSDGRNFATWQPGDVVNKQIREKEGIISNAQYRQYLVANADTIIKGNQLEACNQCGASIAQYNNTNKKASGPFLYKSNLQSSKPIGYETSDLKNVYLSRHDLQSRQITPVITQEQLLKQHLY